MTSVTGFRISAGLPTNWKAKGSILAALLLVSTMAWGAACVGPGGGNNIVYGDIPEASQCDGMFKGNNLPPSDITLFGKTWTYLDTESNAGDPFEGAITLTGLGTTVGTWTIDLSKLGGLYDTFVIALKPDGGYGYFDVGTILTGTWNTQTPAGYCESPTLYPHNAPHFNCAGFGLSHITLYGILDGTTRRETPEPSTLLLLALGLLALVTVARTRVRRPG
jgi:PEP-CTERM motif